MQMPPLPTTRLFLSEAEKKLDFLQSHCIYRLSLCDVTKSNNAILRSAPVVPPHPEATLLQPFLFLQLSENMSLKDVVIMNVFYVAICFIS